jgi:5-methylcytosine-specific restriction endonuclease McrA
MPAALRRAIRQRAKNKCEYCLLAEEHAFFKHEPDHIVAEKHGGETTLENLALACFDCNRFKGSDIASIDPKSKRLTPLFHPRLQVWDEHFKIDQGKSSRLRLLDG